MGDLAVKFKFADSVKKGQMKIHGFPDPDGRFTLLSLQKGLGNLFSGLLIKAK